MLQHFRTLRPIHKLTLKTYFKTPKIVKFVSVLDKNEKSFCKRKSQVNAINVKWKLEVKPSKKTFYNIIV